MPHAKYVFDASADNFPRLVLENSAKGPVLVNYWSPRAGPCMMLMPRLVRLATEFAGRFLLVMLNTDELGSLARAHGVHSLPTVKLFRGGRVIDTLHGAESEASVRAFLSKHLDTRGDALHLAALQAYGQGDAARATALAAEAALATPEDPAIPLDIAKLLVLQERYHQAAELLDALPAEMKDHPPMRALRTHVGFILAARDAPPLADLQRTIDAHPDDLETRYRASAVLLTRNDYDAALDQLLEIHRRDPAFRESIGRHGLLAILQLLGADDPRMHHYRALLNDTAP
jgi:putative thioredoxin